MSWRDWLPKKADIRRGDLIPKHWSGYGRRLPQVGEDGPTEKYFYLYLPSYRWLFDSYHYRHRWHQLVIVRLVCVEGCRQYGSNSDGWRFYYWPCRDAL